MSNTRSQNNNFSSEDVCVTTGTNTDYLRPRGAKGSVVAIEAMKRNSFFQNRPQTKALLSRIPLNPLREEGLYFSTNSRSRLGEYFITPESIALLIQALILDDMTNKYDTNNITFFVNNYGSLFNYLQNLDLQNGQDAKIIFQDDLHGIALYVRNENNKIKALIIDSQASDHTEESNKIYWPYELIAAVNAAFFDAGMDGNLELTLSSTLLQKDTYSCFTFAFQALKYFCKHGSEIFPYIENAGINFNDTLGTYILPPEKLFPSLIKLTQSELNFPDEILNTIVSAKKNLTLRQYLEKFKIIEQGKPYYPAALLKKYKLLGKLDDYITSHTQEPINKNGSLPLPVPLEKVCKKLFR